MQQSEMEGTLINFFPPRRMDQGEDNMDSEEQILAPSILCFRIDCAAEYIGSLLKLTQGHIQGSMP